MYPWNNFLQLKIFQIYHEIIENKDDDISKDALFQSQIGSYLIKLGSKNLHEFSQSQRPIRQGYMSLVIRLGNLLEKNKGKDAVSAYLQSIEADWKDFVDGELKKSNDLNNTNLGGQ